MIAKFARYVANFGVKRFMPVFRNEADVAGHAIYAQLARGIGNGLGAGYAFGPRFLRHQTNGLLHGGNIGVIFAHVAANCRYRREVFRRERFIPRLCRAFQRQAPWEPELAGAYPEALHLL